MNSGCMGRQTGHWEWKTAFAQCGNCPTSRNQLVMSIRSSADYYGLLLPQHTPLSLSRPASTLRMAAVPVAVTPLRRPKLSNSDDTSM